MTKKTAIFTGLMIIALGVVLIVAHNAIGSTGIIITGGILFFLAGVVGLALHASGDARRLYDKDGRRVRVGGRQGVKRAFGIVTAVAAVILGLCMLIFRDTFATLVPFMFGCLVALCALIQLYVLAIGVRPASLSPWLYLVPAALAGGAVYVFMQTTANDSMIMLVTGIALTLFGAACFVESLMVSRALKVSRDNVEESPSLPIRTLD